MSHFTTLRTRLTDRDALVAALHDLGNGDVEVHEHAQPLHGYQGDRTHRAHVIIRRKHLRSALGDIGFALHDGRFTAVIDDSDRRRYDEAWLNRLTARHAYHVASATLAAQGFDLVEEQQERDGTVRLLLRRVG